MGVEEGALGPANKEPGRGQVWTDSPDGDYTNESAWLQSADIDLTKAEAPKLVFEARTDLESNRDFLEIQIGRKKHSVAYEWRTVGELTGTEDWEIHEFDLSKYKGEIVRVNFRMMPDGARTQDGVYLDNIALVDEPPSTP